MKTRTLARVVIFLTLVVGVSPQARATYPVFDIFGNATLSAILSSETAQKLQMVKQLAELKKQVENIQRIEKILQDPKNVSVRDLDSVLKNMPSGDGKGLAGLFTNAGYLDIFMDMSPDQFQKSVADPAYFASTSMMSRALGVTGAELEKMGMTNAEVSLGKSITTRTVQGDGQVDFETGKRVADLLGLRVLSGVKKNAERQNKLAAIVADDKKAANQAGSKDLSSQLAVVNAQSNTANNIALEGMRQQGDANAAVTSQLQRQNEILDNESYRDKLNRAYGRKK